MIIGISGKMRSGKDTVANYIQQKYGFEHTRFSKGIKEIYNTYHYKDNKGIKPRMEYQEIGQGLRAILGENVWVNYTLKGIDPTKHTVISDVRQDNEFHALREKGALIILVKTSEDTQKRRLGSLGETDDSRLEHETEQITESLADIIIYNDSTLEELYKKIDAILAPVITGSKE